ncbi:hypothetical protein SDC9_155894 [bioreactor metagenome]|uniref:Glycosyl transferase family 1 domain-containing protein n=1 Tax=bioreactor metagenome TaxID=1076179 RepID=A0A645F433_9ZZZZ
MQLKLFKKNRFHHKMSYIDMPYSLYGIRQNCINHGKIVFGYSGTYNSNYRNLKPLINVFKNNSDIYLEICGKGNFEIIEQNNIKINGWIKPNKIVEIENGFDVIVCILNKNSAQIPGKIFFNSNSEKPILVILDGENKDIIKSYLEQFNRYIFCENNESSIYDAISYIIKNKDNLLYQNSIELSPKYITSFIINKNND